MLQILLSRPGTAPIVAQPRATRPPRRWQLPPDHPITAPGYSARRSAMAKEIGLGRGRKTANAAPPADPEPAPSTSVNTGRDQ
jgi:hypothetical protein